MALNFRALLIPTAAIDSAGRAKPDAVFSVTPLAGGSPVPVYAAVQGGTALDPGQVKTDALGNISGLYVTAPGPYTLSFAGGGTVVTSAVMDSRDVATSGDLADALAAGGGSLELADYSYDPDTDTWTVQPNATPGTAMFTAQEGQLTNPGGLQSVEFDTAIANPRVAALDPVEPHKIVIATTGMYLVSITAQLFSGDWDTEWTDTLRGDFDGASPAPYAVEVASNPTPLSQLLQASGPVLLHEGWVCGLTVGSTDHAWQVKTITRVMLIRLT